SIPEDGAVNPSYARDPASVNRPLVTVKDLLWLIYLYPVRFLARTLPVGFLHWLGGLAKPLFRMARRKQMKSMAGRMALATGKESSSPHVRKASRAFVENAVVRAMDDLVLDRLVNSGRLKCAELRGEGHLKKAMASGRGVMVVTGHFYAGRVGKRYLAEIGYPLMSVRFGRRLDRRMGRLGQKLFWTRYSRFLHNVIGDEVLITDPEVSLKILRRLRSDGLVNI
ncbi:MAG: hypothetical protein GY953_35600, partial [bacterium]|nr:hypothetical protein [bacterium]